MIARAVAFVKNVDTSYWNFGTCLGQVGRNTADKLQLFRFKCFFQTAVEFNVVFVGNENGQVRKLGYLGIVDCRKFLVQKYELSVFVVCCRNGFVKLVFISNTFPLIGSGSSTLQDGTAKVIANSANAEKSFFIRVI